MLINIRKLPYFNSVSIQAIKTKWRWSNEVSCRSGTPMHLRLMMKKGDAPGIPLNV